MSRTKRTLDIVPAGKDPRAVCVCAARNRPCTTSHGHTEAGLPCKVLQGMPPQECECVWCVVAAGGEWVVEWAVVMECRWWWTVACGGVLGWVAGCVGGAVSNKNGWWRRWCVGRGGMETVDAWRGWAIYVCVCACVCAARSRPCNTSHGHAEAGLPCMYCRACHPSGVNTCGVKT